MRKHRIFKKQTVFLIGFLLVLTPIQFADVEIQRAGATEATMSILENGTFDASVNGWEQDGDALLAWEQTVFYGNSRGSMKIKTNSVGSGASCTVSLRKNCWYTYTVMVRSAANTVTPRLSLNFTKDPYPNLNVAANPERVYFGTASTVPNITMKANTNEWTKLCYNFQYKDTDGSASVSVSQAYIQGKFTITAEEAQAVFFVDHISIVPTSALQDGNLVFNGNFMTNVRGEQTGGAAGWIGQSNTAVLPKEASDPGFGNTVTLPCSNGSLSQTVALEPGVQYEISAWVKDVSVTPKSRTVGALMQYLLKPAFTGYYISPFNGKSMEYIDLSDGIYHHIKTRFLQRSNHAIADAVLNLPWVDQARTDCTLAYRDIRITVASSELENPFFSSDSNVETGAYANSAGIYGWKAEETTISRVRFSYAQTESSNPPSAVYPFEGRMSYASVTQRKGWQSPSCQSKLLSQNTQYHATVILRLADGSENTRAIPDGIKAALLLNYEDGTTQTVMLKGTLSQNQWTIHEEVFAPTQTKTAKVTLLIDAEAKNAELASYGNFYIQECNIEPYEPTCFYVDSVHGSDVNYGTTAETAFQTISRAQQAVRERNKFMTEDIYVYLRGGEHRVSEPICFTTKDSGTNGYYVRYMCYEDEQPVVSGGRDIKGFTLFDAEKNIYAAPKPSDIKIRQLYVNGVRKKRARSADAMGITVSEDGSCCVSENTAMLSWSDIQQAEIVWKIEWTNPRCKIERVVQDGATVRIYMKEPGWTYLADRGIPSVRPSTVENIASKWNTPPWYVENAYALLDEPGEWYADDTLIYYIPSEGESMDEVRVTVPAVETLMCICGEGEQTPVRNLFFSGIDFCYQTWLRPETEGRVSDAQNNQIREWKGGINDAVPPGAVMVDTARAITFQNCEFSKGGITGLEFVKGVKNSNVIGCAFTDLSGNAMQIGASGAIDRGAPTTYVEDILISQNLIYDIGVEYRSASAIGADCPVRCEISHNEIYDIPYSGIHIKSNMKQKDITSGVRILYNRIYEIMNDGIFDGGAIYAQGQTSGTVFDRNLIHGNYVKNQYVQAAYIYIDNGSNHWEISENVVDSLAVTNWSAGRVENMIPQWAVANNGDPPSNNNLFYDNYSTTQAYYNGGIENTWGTFQYVPDGDWPDEALAIIENSGREKTEAVVSVEETGENIISVTVYQNQDSIYPIHAFFAMYDAENRLISLRENNSQCIPYETTKIDVQVPTDICWEKAKFMVWNRQLMPITESRNYQKTDFPFQRK